MQRQRFQFKKSQPTYEGPAIPSMVPRLTYSEDLREGDLEFQNKIADNILRAIFSSDHLSSARGSAEPSSGVDTVEFEKAAFNDETLNNNYNGNKKKLERFLNKKDGKGKISELRKYLKSEMTEETLKKIIICKFESETRIKNDLEIQSEFSCDTVAIMICNRICYIAANYKNREAEQFVYGLQPAHIQLIQAILSENNHEFYKIFDIESTYMITPTWEPGVSREENNTRNAAPHAEMQCLAALCQKNPSQSTPETLKKISSPEKVILGVSKSCCKKCKEKLKQCSITIPDRFGEHEVYLLKKLPGEESLKSQYKRTYIFVKPESEPVQLYYISYNGDCNKLSVQDEEFKKIIIPEGIDLSKPLSETQSTVAKELWTLIKKNPGHVQLRKSKDDPSNWQDPAEIKVKLTSIPSTLRRHSFELMPPPKEPYYSLYLVSKFNLEECGQIKKHAIILTNEDTAFFVNNGKIVMSDDKPQFVKNINRQGIEIRKEGAILDEYLSSLEKRTQIVKECLAKKQEADILPTHSTDKQFSRRSSTSK
ncbi:MAG: hypothetical protein JSR33_04475 [Proteobacteria bacterium]|nr:hypothetical protein [Pseudomonadota bacterium]